jgi:malate synthase
MGLKLIQNYLILLIMKLFPGTNINSEEFWTSFANTVHELAPLNKKVNSKKRRNSEKK